MGLSSELISQFAKITNDKKTTRIEEVTLYGEVVQCDESICVRFDGSEELTPVTTITEKDDKGNITNFKYGAASVKTGDRVSVSLKNHSATITGNLSDPPMGRAEVLVTEDSIVAKVGENVQVQIDELGVKVNGLTTFQNGLENGETSIDGGCIKTGTIDAERLNLKGSISFSDFDTELKTNLSGLSDSVTNAVDTANEAKSIAQSITIPGYIQETYIDSTTIMSPTIEGNDIRVYGTFQTIGATEYGNVSTGYMGAARGMDGDGQITYGVALSNGWSSIDQSVGSNYVIVTNGGVRLQAGDNNIVVTNGSIRINTGAGCKAYYNGVEIGTNP